MKSGLNYLDVNALEYCLGMGISLDEFASSISCKREVVDGYIASMDPDRVQELKSRAPAVGADMEAIKATLKAEILEELYGEAEAADEEATPAEEETSEAYPDGEVD